MKTYNVRIVVETIVDADDGKSAIDKAHQLVKTTLKSSSTWIEAHKYTAKIVNVQ